MAADNPFEAGAKITSKIPRKVWIGAVALGAVIGLVWLWRGRDAEPEEAGVELIEGEIPATGEPYIYSGSPMAVPYVGDGGGYVENPQTGVYPLDPLDFQPVLDAIQGLLDSTTAPVGVAPMPIADPIAAAPATTPRQTASTPAPAPKKPCCLYNGHTLSWWRNPNINKKSGKWRWPDGSGKFKHSRAFEGHKACDGGGSANGSKRDC